MKKILAPFITLLLLTILLLPSVQGECATPMAKFPYISFDRIAIGGIQPNATNDYVRSVYGEPDEITNRRGTKFYNEGDPDEVWIYGKTFSISFSNGKVYSVISEGDNGLSTPDNIKVGDNETKVISVYGQKGKLGYWYRSDNACNLTISVKNGKVTRIFAGWDL